MPAAIDAQSKVLAKLIDGRQITRRVVEDMLLEARASGVFLVDLLVERDLISEADIARLYADYYGLRYLDLSRRRPSPVWMRTLPENLARRMQFLVFNEVDGQLVIAVTDPADAAIRHAVQTRYDRDVQYVVSPRYQILEAIDEVFSQARRRGARLADDAPVAQTAGPRVGAAESALEEIQKVIDEAVDRRASDIHLEPERDRLRVRMRIDGRLIEARSYPLDAAPGLISRVKILSGLDITERRKPQDGRFTAESFHQMIDIRVACVPTVVGDRSGERMTLRLLGMDRDMIGFAQLGMEEETVRLFTNLIHRPHGIILITGPTGSGKSTTLYSALQSINSLDKHIITIEDPVEYDIEGVNQVQVDAEFGVTFPAALRSLLRHDPDVIMVGEIRDQETAHLALEASLTGHLVFATLHTNSAAGACTRLLDMGCEPYLVSSGVVGILAQRLVRKICGNCRQAFQPNETERKLMGIEDGDAEVEIFRGTGCTRCLRTGYFDRLGVFEYVEVDAGLQELVMQKATTETIQEYLARQGALTLRADAMSKVSRGLTTLEESVRVVAGQ